jgi:hypothetical protein
MYAMKITKPKLKSHYLVMLYLCCLIFSAGCSNKSETSNTNENPFSSTNGGETIDSQILKPCKWSYRVEQDPTSKEAMLISTAKLDSGWHLYSQHISKKGLSTVFVYNDLSNFKLVGETEEGDSKKEYDQYLEVEVLFFENEAVFEQKIKVLSKEDFTITGTIDYTVCLEQCVISDEEFSFNVKGNR